MVKVMVELLLFDGWNIMDRYKTTRQVDYDKAANLIIA